MKNLFISFFTLVTFSFGAFAQIDPKEIEDLIQNGSEDLIVRENSRLMQEDFLYYADLLSTRLLEFDPKSFNYNYRKGYTLLYSKTNPSSALKYFEYAIGGTVKNYDAFSKSEKNAPFDAHFHYAECLHKLGEFDKAIEQLYIFKEKSRDESELLNVINVKIQQIQNAKNANGPNLQPVNLTNINTEYPDFAPLISLDGTLLFYTARRPWPNHATDNFLDRKQNFPPEDGYISILQNNTWGDSKKLDVCQPKTNEAGLAMSPNEREIILYSDSTGNGDLYFGYTGSNNFNPSKLALDSALNTEFWETHATFSADAKTVYFTSDRDGGLGGRDIYKVIQDDNGKWSEPINLGAPINTHFDEDGPFLSYNGKVLYFSSNGMKSYGGFDIFYSRLTDMGSWEEPQNLGAPYNTTYDDVFYSTTIDAKTVYFSSNRKDGEGSLDIYTVNNAKALTEIAAFKGIIKTSTGIPLPESAELKLTLSCVDCIVKEKEATLSPRLRDGTFYTDLEPCKTYKIALYNPGKTESFHQETFITECNVSYQEVVREFLYDMQDNLIKDYPVIVPIDTTPVVTYKNLEFLTYFEYNKNKVSTKELDLKNMLAEVEAQLIAGREKITINIYSSASYVPTRTYKSNEQLATLRAENMKKYLINYFNAMPSLKDKVTITITSAIVDGPAYEKDAFNKGKYKPYQFVGLKTE